MSQHELAFTLLTSQSSDDTVVLSTQREFRDQSGTSWVETADGKVKKVDLDKAQRGVSDLEVNRYGESLTGDRELDDEVRELLAERRRQKLADNKAAIARKATIQLPVEDAREFKVGTWYRLRFEEIDQGVPLRSLIGNVVHEHDTVAVERRDERERSAERPS